MLYLAQFDYMYFSISIYKVSFFSSETQKTKAKECSNYMQLCSFNMIVKLTQNFQMYKRA